MITSTSFNEAFCAKVREAARVAIRNSAAWTREQGTPADGQAYVKNRRGRLMMRVAYRPGASPSLQFLEGSKRDITPLVQRQLGGLL